MNRDLSSLISGLSRVREFTIKAISPAWSDEGHGLVDVQSDPFQLTWWEQGHWNKSGDKMAFSNVYRWKVENASRLSLEHLRYGVDHPVKLVSIENTRLNHWQSICPYTCGADKYTLEMEVKGSHLELYWSIQGPSKNQATTIYYSC